MADGERDRFTELLFEGVHLRLVRRGGWEFIERTKTACAAVIAAVTDDRRLVLVEQYRIPVGASVIELPAGLAGDIAGHEDEPVLDAAKRELVEETAFAARNWKLLAKGPPSPGLNSEMVEIYLATGLYHEGSEKDESEDIVVHLVPLKVVDHWLEQQVARGALVDPKVYAGLYFVHRAGLGEHLP